MEDEMGRVCSTNDGEAELNIGYCWENQKEEGVCRWIILKWVLERQDGVVWTGLIWLRIRTSGAL
jgi:hypothetical protein